MVHPYKKYDEHRHGREVAKKRGYQSGGIVKFPSAGREDLQRLRSSQGVESGRIPGVARDNVVAGPGRNSVTGGIKRSWLNRQEERDMMPRAKGGRILSSDTIQDKKLVKRAMAAHDKQLHGGKHTKLGFSRGGGLGMTAGAESGAGRLQKARMQARLRKKQ